MELIPIEHKISKEIQQAWDLAKLYENAGVTRKSVELKGNCIKMICSENNIPILDGGCNRIHNWHGLDWGIKELSEVEAEVPVHVLQQMARISDKHRAYIAFPLQRSLPDPVLLYKLPYFPFDDFYIEIARWDRYQQALFVTQRARNVHI